MSDLISREDVKLMLSELLQLAEKERFTAYDVINHAVEWIDNMPTVEDEDDGYIRPMHLEEMAEQLKEGGNSES